MTTCIMKGWVGGYSDALFFVGCNREWWMLNTPPSLLFMCVDRSVHQADLLIGFIFDTF